MKNAFRSLCGITLALAIISPAFALDDRENWIHSGDNVFENGNVDLNGNLTITQKDGGFRLTKEGAISTTSTIEGVAGLRLAGISTNGSTVASVDYGNLRKDTIAISGTSIKLPNRPSSNGVYSVKIGAWPTGRIYVVGVMMDDFRMTTNAASLTSTSHVTYALGTAAGANSSLSGTAVNLCPTGATVQATNTFDACLASPASFDGTTTPVEMWLNVCVDSNYVATGTTNLTYGTIRAHSINLGDY